MTTLSRKELRLSLDRAGFVEDEAQVLQLYLASLPYKERLDLLRRLLGAAADQSRIELSIPRDPGKERALILDAQKVEAAPLVFLRDPSRRVRRALAEGLVKIDWVGQGPMLSALVHDDDPLVQQSVRQGLKPNLVHVLETSLKPGAGLAAFKSAARAKEQVAEESVADEVQRYTDITFEPGPANLSTGELRIALRIEAQREAQEALDIRVPPGKNEAWVLVHASSTSWTVRPPLRRIRVPRGKDSDEAVFEILAPAPGKGRVRLTLWDEYRIIGSLVVDLEAQDATDGLVLLWDGRQVFRDPAKAVPRSSLGVTIQVGWAGGGDLHIEYWAHVPEGEHRRADLVPMGRSAVRYDPASSQVPLAALRDEIDLILKGLEKPETLGVASQAEALDTLGGDLDSLGKQIAYELLSDEVRSLLFNTRSVVQWAVKDPELDAIPWELARMPLTQSAVADDLVLLRAPISPGLELESNQNTSPPPPEPDSERPRLTYLLGRGLGKKEHFPLFGGVIDNIRDRYDVVTNFLSEQGWESLSRAEIRKRVTGAQVVHILCHGRVDAKQGVNLEIGDPPLGSLRPEHTWSWQLEAGALVVVSACSSAASGFTPAGVRSFGWNIVRAGASVYLGTLAPVTTSVAITFARAFFDARLSKGLEIPEALRAARRAAANGDNPTWKFYVVYGELP